MALFPILAFPDYNVSLIIIQIIFFPQKQKCFIYLFLFREVKCFKLNVLKLFFLFIIFKEWNFCFHGWITAEKVVKSIRRWLAAFTFKRKQLINRRLILAEMIRSSNQLLNLSEYSHYLYYKIILSKIVHNSKNFIIKKKT